MDKLYIPGDLVMTNGVSGSTAKDVVYRVTSSEPSRIFVLDDGTVLKGIVRLENLKDAKLENEGYLYYGSSYVYFKDIIPISLTPEILEKNGWDFTGYNTDFNGTLLNICSKRDILPYLYYYYATKDFSVSICGKIVLSNIKYVHELQHLLFGLGLNSEMEVQV